MHRYAQGQRRHRVTRVTVSADAMSFTSLAQFHTVLLAAVSHRGVVLAFGSLGKKIRQTNPDTQFVHHLQ